MNKIPTLSLVAVLGLSASSLFGGVANFNYGTAAESGGAMFLGADGGAADSVTVGYFAGDVFSADLTGWNVLDANTSGVLGGFFSSTTANTDTTAATGLTAYLLIADGAYAGFVNLDSWASFSGTVAPALPEALSYVIGAAATSASVNTFAGVDSVITVTDGQGTDFAGGFSGSGVSIQVVPEPSTYAALSGLLALGYVMVRRRRA
ncbi:PEP-CTERM sorting domain-containing protein [Opitutales bacterium]|nr:PEP-CTERM sorting domain-containing protein [Opitutales bacterium]